MRFIVKPWTRFPEDYKVEGPCIILLSDNWDDFGYKTCFSAYYVLQDGTRKDLSSVRILHRSEKTTKLVIPSEFYQLPVEYCSLGSTMDYYEKLSNLGHEVYDDVLKCLNDAAIFTTIREQFNDHEGFMSSLLRNGSNALNNANDYLKNSLVKQKYTFSYETKLDNAENSHKVDFSFFRNDGLPYRVTAIIGKNGTGKTRYLADLTNDLISDFKDNQDKFNGNRPSFGMILSLSYSAFTQFNNGSPKSENGTMYQNFGALDQDSRFNAELMLTKLKDSIKRIIEFERVEFWLEILEEIQSEEFKDRIEQVIVTEQRYDVLEELSSGQRMIFEIITNIVANIRLNTLIIFDEPEIHLHPNAIAVLLKALYTVLDKYDSFAILATHIPHVIQQIPSDSVVVFERIGQTAIVRKLEFESFGENLSELTIGVFETNNVFDNYKHILKKLSSDTDYEDVLLLFNNKLSLNARIYLKSCY